MKVIKSKSESSAKSAMRRIRKGLIDTGEIRQDGKDIFLVESEHESEQISEHLGRT
jgi:hypothetical protein